MFITKKFFSEEINYLIFNLNFKPYDRFGGSNFRELEALSFAKKTVWAEDSLLTDIGLHLAPFTFSATAFWLDYTEYEPNDWWLTRKLVAYLQDSDSVWWTRSLPPACDTDDCVSCLDEAVLLSKVNAKLDSVVDVLTPVLCPALRVEERYHAPEDLHGSGGRGWPGDREEGALRSVLRSNVSRPSSGSQADDGWSTSQVRRLHSRDRGRWGRVVDCIVFLNSKNVIFL